VDTTNGRLAAEVLKPKAYEALKIATIQDYHKERVRLIDTAAKWFKARGQTFDHTMRPHVYQAYTEGKGKGKTAKGKRSQPPAEGKSRGRNDQQESDSSTEGEQSSATERTNWSAQSKSIGSKAHSQRRLDQQAQADKDHRIPRAAQRSNPTLGRSRRRTEWKGAQSGPAPESLNGITEETDESAEWTDGQGDDFGAEDFGRDWEGGWEGRDYNDDYYNNGYRPTATAPKKPTRDRRPDSEQALSEKNATDATTS